MDQLWAELGSWPERFIQAISEVGGPGPDNQSGLVASVGDLVTIRSAIRRKRRFRPWLAAWRATDEVLKCFEDVAAAYLDALSADVPLVAQRAARLGQAAIHAAGRVAGDLTVRIERAQRLQDGLDAVDTLIAATVEARAASGGTNLLEIDASGHELYGRVTGSGECPVGFGFTLVLADVLTDVILDQDRFWPLVRDIYRGLIRHEGGLRAVVGVPEWRNDVEDAAQRLFDSSVAQHAISAVAVRDRDHARSALGLSQDVIEGVAKKYLATVLAVQRRDDYRQLRRRDAADLVRQVAQSGMNEAAEGLDMTLRRARAHEDFHIREDGIVVTDRGAESRRLSFDELGDAVLKVLETSLALQVGVYCAAAHVGFPLESVDPMLILEIPAEDKARLAATIAGWSNPQAERDGTKVILRGETELHPASINEVAMIAPYLDETVHELELVASCGSDVHILAGPLNPVRGFSSETSEPDKGASLLEVAHSWTFDGQPVVGMRHIEKWAVMTFAEALQSDAAERARRLRVLRNLARRVHNPSLEDRLRNITAVLRNHDLGLPLNDQEQETLHWFSELAEERLPGPFS